MSGVLGSRLERSWSTSDIRGSFTKPFSIDPASPGADGPILEVFWSASHRGVIRGMHVQGPHRASAKVVFVVSGRLHDIVLDLRRGSPTYGVFEEFELDPSLVLHVPVGCAHGFQALEDSQMVYLCDQPYSPESDHGIRFDTFGAAWPLANPTVSDRDRELPAFDTYMSRFP